MTKKEKKILGSQAKLSKIGFTNTVQAMHERISGTEKKKVE